MARMPSRARGRAALVIGLLALAACGSRGPAPGESGTPRSGGPRVDAADGPDATAVRPPSPVAPEGPPATRIFIDPVTGQPREPTAEELAELARREAALPQNAKATGAPVPQEFRLPDGTVGMRFPEGAAQPLMACRRLDGQVDEHCHLPAVPDPPAPPSGPAP